MTCLFCSGTGKCQRIRGNGLVVYEREIVDCIDCDGTGE